MFPLVDVVAKVSKVRALVYVWFCMVSTYMAVLPGIHYLHAYLLTWLYYMVYITRLHRPRKATMAYTYMVLHGIYLLWKATIDHVNH